MIIKLLSKLVNIINLSLFKFMNKLINALFTNEKLNQILTELILLKNISNKDLKEIIKKSDYVFRYQLTKNNEKLNLLNFTLKEYFSVKISSKYNKLKYSSNYNQLILEKLLKDETNKDIFDFILNSLFIKDWNEIFLYKKDLNDFVIYKVFYFHCFFFIAYNLYRFLIMKEKRNKNKFFYKHEIGENCILKSLLKNAKFEN